ncbi:hypothetical protein QQ045_014559 [Rhodiola kirilowii]
MADQPIPIADQERVNTDVAAALAAVMARMDAMSIQLTEMAASRGNLNGGEERAHREAPIRVPRVERACVVRAGDSSSGEEDPVNYGRDEEEYRYVSGIKISIQEKMGLQTVWSVAAASSLALKAEAMERAPRNFQPFRRFPPQGAAEIGDDKGKNVMVKEPYARNKSITGPSSDNSASPQPNRGAAQKAPNPYTKPSGDKCYRCGGLGHRSNVCPTRRTVAILEERESYEPDEEDEYEGVEFAEEESTEVVNIVLQRVLLTMPDEGQRKNLFKSQCSILNKSSKQSNFLVMKHIEQEFSADVEKIVDVKEAVRAKLKALCPEENPGSSSLEVEETDAVTYKCRMVKVLKVGDDVIQPRKHGPFKVDEVLYLEENSRSSSFEVEETDVGAFRVLN